MEERRHMALASGLQFLVGKARELLRYHDLSYHASTLGFMDLFHGTSHVKYPNHITTMPRDMLEASLTLHTLN